MIGLCLKYEQINYGSKLQVLATLRVMEELGQECYPLWESRIVV